MRLAASSTEVEVDVKCRRGNLALGCRGPSTRRWWRSSPHIVLPPSTGGSLHSPHSWKYKKYQRYIWPEWPAVTSQCCQQSMQARNILLRIGLKVRLNCRATVNNLSSYQIWWLTPFCCISFSRINQIFDILFIQVRPLISLQILLHPACLILLTRKLFYFYPAQWSHNISLSHLQSYLTFQTKFSWPWRNHSTLFPLT